MKKPSLVITLALLNTYGLNKPSSYKRSAFMCNAINNLKCINRSEAEQAVAAVMEFVYSYDAHENTLWGALEKRGVIQMGISKQKRMRTTRWLYIKLVFKLFFKGL